MRNSLIRTEETVEERAGETRLVPDNLTAIQGIGEVREQTLYAAGIMTLAQLAEAEPDELLRIFAGRVTPTMIRHWQEQAAL